MKRNKISRISSLALLAVIALAGCRSEEQGRVIKYEPGVYKGKSDTPLTADQQRLLRKRSVHPGVGGTGDVSKPALLPPSAAITLPTHDVEVDPDKRRAQLNSRVRLQKGSGL